MESRLRAGCNLAGLSKLMSAGLLIFFTLAACVTLRLAAAEARLRWAHAGQIGEETPAALRAAVASNPRNSRAWIALGLAAEREGAMTEAAGDFEAAEKVDRQYLPAWSSANFYYRRQAAPEFWSAAARAAALVYDDPRPLIALADRMEPDSWIALTRLRATPLVERAYLDFLIGGSRWDQADRVARKILKRGQPEDSDRLQAFTDRLLQAGRADSALSLCRQIQNCPAPDPAGNIVVNGDFRKTPNGHGFDWKILAPPGVKVAWKTGEVSVTYSGSDFEEGIRLEQWIVLPARRCRLEFDYQAPGRGLRWAVSQGDLPQLSGAALAPSQSWTQGRWDFTARRTGLARLSLLYRREPGSSRMAGRAAVRQVRLETL